MILSTLVNIPKSEFSIDYQSKLMFVGSCFADNISKKFDELRFNVQTNPFGILYNPLSISKMIERVCNKRFFSDKNVFLDFKNQDYWHCWETHGVMSYKDKTECIDKLNSAIKNAHSFLKEADAIFITLGTAFVYFLKENNEAVANCHKQDSNLFKRKLISTETATQALYNIVKNLRILNSKIRIVFTVSPLRHLSDGLHNNTLSKSTLHLAIHNVLQMCESIEEYNNLDCCNDLDCRKNHAIANDQEIDNIKICKNHAINYISYFPSYEIVIDELRDYRFYNSDMIHLSEISENIIFERMQQAYMSEITIENIKSVGKFLKNVNHKIIDKESNKTKDFLKDCIAQANSLEQYILGLDLTQDKEKLKNAL